MLHRMLANDLAMLSGKPSFVILRSLENYAVNTGKLGFFISRSKKRKKKKLLYVVITRNNICCHDNEINKNKSGKNGSIKYVNPWPVRATINYVIINMLCLLYYNKSSQYMVCICRI